MIVEYFFYVANALFLISSYPMIREALKNRAVLRGFSFSGSLCTSAGMITMLAAYLYMGSYFSVLLAVPTAAYWLIVTYYSRN